MTADTDGWGFAPPPFKPDEGLQRLRRDLRELGLTEREGVFERRGQAVAKATVEGGVLAVAVVRRPVRSSPEWQASTLQSSAQIRDFVANLKRRLAQWSDSDE